MCNSITPAIGDGYPLYLDNPQQITTTSSSFEWTYHVAPTGETAREVKILQAHMNRLGFSVGPAGIDGILGPDTDAAIRAMQRYLNTLDDGYVGPITRSLINKSC